jgi:hypothetical protein
MPAQGVVAAAVSPSQEEEVHQLLAHVAPSRQLLGHSRGMCTQCCIHVGHWYGCRYTVISNAGCACWCCSAAGYARWLGAGIEMAP